MGNDMNTRKNASVSGNNNTKNANEKRYGLPVGSRAILGPDNKILSSKKCGTKSTKMHDSDNNIHKTSEKAVENKQQNIRYCETNTLSAANTEKKENKELIAADKKSDVSIVNKYTFFKGEKIKTVSCPSDVRTKKPFPVFTCVTMVFVCALLMFIVLNYVQLFENESTLNDLKHELESMKEEEKRLSGELEQKNDIISISKYATEKLGMVGSENQQSIYIDLSEDDSIQGYEPSNTDYGAIATVMDALGESAKAWIGVFGN